MKQSSLKIYMIAGEASGDLHGANLLKALKEENPLLECRAWGGDLMEKAGAKVVKHYRELAFMGFAEVIMNLRTILNNIKLCKEDILVYKPDLVILIDYPGFNMRISTFLKEQGILNFYYISPQIWAWKQNRVYKIRKTVDAMFVILPFEKAFYQKFDYEVTYVGHPLLDAVEQYLENGSADKNILPQSSEKPIIALLPGSRKQEIKTMLPVMLKAAEAFPNAEIVVAGAPSQTEEFYREVAPGNVKIIFDATYNLLSVATVAMVTSGTATLETALFKVPQVVCYKGNFISYQIAKRLIKVNYISLVNLIADKEIVKELIQDEFTVQNLVNELNKLMPNMPQRKKQLDEYTLLNQILGGGGASKVAAKGMLKTLHSSLLK
ncbi:MAG: lipid-A-disaccharide synthase [Luteibaculaceae bacterium]